MKRTLSMALVLAMLCSMFVPSLAAEITMSGAQSSNTVVTYGMSESYIVTVPDAATIGSDGIGNITVSIANALLASNKKLSVYITGDSYTGGYWHLTEANEASNQLKYNITKAGSKIANNDEVLSVLAGLAWNSSVSTTLQLALADSAVQAGVYNDTLTFVVECEDATQSSMEMNEYGFYYNQPYSGVVQEDGLMMSVELVFYEDQTVAIWTHDTIAQSIPVEYADNTITIIGFSSTGSGGNSTISVSNNGTTMTIEDVGIELTLASVQERAPQSGSYIADPNHMILPITMTAEYQHQVEVKLYENGEQSVRYDLSVMEYRDGKILENGVIAGLYHPNGQKLALFDGDDGLVFVRVDTDTTLNETHNLYYNRLYTNGAGTTDGLGLVVYEDGTYEAYAYIAPSEGSVWDFLNQTYVGWICVDMGSIDDLTLVAQNTPYTIGIQDGNGNVVVYTLSGTEIHDIYWGQTYTTELKNVELDPGEVINGVISVVLTKTEMALTFEGDMNGEAIALGFNYKDGVYTVYEGMNGETYPNSYDNATYETLRHIAVAIYTEESIDGNGDTQTTENAMYFLASPDGKMVSLMGMIFTYLPGHDYVTEVLQQGSCTEDSVLRHTCKDCGDTYTETISAPGHIDDNVDTYCDTCGTQITPEYTQFVITAENRHMVGCTDSTSRLNIPATFKGEDGVWYKVTEIGDGAFASLDKLTSITLPKTVTKIGEMAFAMTGITTFSMPDNNNLQYIANGAFGICPNLNSVDLGNCTNLETIGQALCAFSTNLRYATFPAQALIMSNPFYQNEPVSVTVTGDNAMTRLVDGVLYSNYDKTLLYYPQTKTNTSYNVLPTTEVISSNAVYKNPYLQNVTLPNGLKEIHSEGFMYCTALQSIVIPDSVTKIGQYAFGFCESLEKVVMSRNVTEIDGWVFEYTAIKSIGVIGSGADCELSPNTTSFSYCAFTNCSNLTTVDLSEMTKFESICPTTGAFYSRSTFDNCPITTLKLPTSLKYIHGGCFDWDIEEMGYEKPVMSVYITDLEAFCQIQGQTDYRENMLNGARLFINGVEATDITLPQMYYDNIYGNEIFAGCLSIETVRIPASTTVIPQGLFWACPNLKQVIFEVQTGWQRKTSFNDEYQDFDSATIADADRMASYFGTTYSWWRRQ